MAFACVPPGVPLCGTVVCYARNGGGAEHAALFRLDWRSLDAVVRHAADAAAFRHAMCPCCLLSLAAWPHHSPFDLHRPTILFIRRRPAAAHAPARARARHELAETPAASGTRGGQGAATEQLLQTTVRLSAAPAVRAAQHAAAPLAGGNHAFVAAAARRRACVRDAERLQSTAARSAAAELLTETPRCCRARCRLNLCATGAVVTK